MRLLVISDTHRYWQRMYDVVERHPEADVVLHLGDLVDDADNVRAAMPDKNIISVAGNCDYGNCLPGERVMELGGKTVFLTHGNAYNVKHGVQYIEAAAHRLHADICLYGHTHVPESYYTDGLYVLNPGSLGNPRSGFPTYGMVDITDSGIAVIIAEYRQ